MNVVNSRGLVPMNVKVRREDLAALGELVRAEARREQRWRGIRVARIPDGLTSRERSEHLQAVRVERARLRAADQLMGTADLLLG
ncbi:hypothetical protein [Embleya sp. NPDC005971]|uniref:hypothetical protein n=1 Tax=Embleya sp. NPDC005971 TaxID=3156724 RepID=UPI00340766C3